MSDVTKQPWLQIIGVGEDGLDGLNDASKKLLADAAVIFGSHRQLDLVQAGQRGENWPVPFSVEPLLARRGAATVMLASGDPFWFGAGTSVTRHLPADEWQCQPGASTFSLAASRLGWALEEIGCFALHARPFDDMRLALQQGQRAIVLLRDRDAVSAFVAWLQKRGFGASSLHILEALAGPRERVRSVLATDLPGDIIAHPVAVAVEMVGETGLSLVPGRATDLFTHDGQISKSPMRAMTLAQLAPKEGLVLWDLGAGSGAISVEWCLAGRQTRAVAVEQNPARAANINRNIANFGLSRRMQVIEGMSFDCLDDLPVPDAVFIGGGADNALLGAVIEKLPLGARLVVNAVTLESAALLTAWQGRIGGELMQIALSQNKALGQMQAWQAAYPVTQWVYNK